MTHSDIQELLGAYSIDAVDPDEAALVEAHLAECPSCRSEVAAHRETVAKLGNLGGDAPTQLWDRLAGELSFGQLPPVRPVVRLASRRPLAVPAAALFAAAATVLIVLLGVSTLHLRHQVDALRGTVGQGGLEQAAAAAILNPDHTIVHLTSSGGPLDAEVVTLPDGQAYLVNSNLPAVGAGRTYQLWGLTGSSEVSLGLLGPQPQLAAFRIEPTVTQLMVTAEPAGGRPTPDSPILIQGAV